MTEAHQDWERLATFVRDRRDELRLTQQDLATRSRVSLATVYALESVGRTTFTSSTLRKVSRGLEWTADSAGDVLTGGDPEPDADISEDQQTLRELLVSIDERLAEVQVSIDERLARIEGRLDELATARAPSTDFDPGEALAERRAQPGPRPPVGLPTGPGAPRDEEAESSGGGRRAG